MDLIQKMVNHHVWLVGELLTRATGLSEAQLDAQIEISVEGIDEHPTLRSLLARLVGQMDMWVSSVELREYDFDIEHGEGVSHMQNRLSTVGPAFVALVHDLCTHERLDESFVDATCKPPRVFSYGGMIAHVLTFAAHRRTLVVGALHDLGITDLAAGDPMQWVAESS